MSKNNSVSNGMIYLIYTLATLIFMPFLYLNTRMAINEAAIIFTLLMLITLIVRRKIRSIKCKWMKCFDKFSEDTYIFGYILTSLGYLMVVSKMFTFWWVYGILVAAFSVFGYFDFVQPLVTYLRER